MQELLADHNAWIVFVASFFAGETMIITAAALAAHGHWPLIAVFGYAFAGTVSSDATWFLIARKWWPRLEAGGGERSKRILSWLESKTGDRPHLALLYVKFLYGTRILAITYMSIRRVALSRFIASDALGTLGWLSVMVAIGWFAGAGISQLAGSRLKLVIPMILVVVLLVKGSVVWITRWLLRR